MKDKISWHDFEKIDIRIGTIVSVEDFPEAKKAAYKLTIDFGNEIGIKRTSAQITSLYSKEVLIGKQIVAILNFPKKQIANFFSECLVLGSINNNQEVVLLSSDMVVENGLKIA